MMYHRCVRIFFSSIIVTMFTAVIAADRDDASLFSRKDLRTRLLDNSKDKSEATEAEADRKNAHHAAYLHAQALARRSAQYAHTTKSDTPDGSKKEEDRKRMHSPSYEGISQPPIAQIAWQTTLAYQPAHDWILHSKHQLIAVLAHACVTATTNPAQRYVVKFDEQGKAVAKDIYSFPLVPDVTPPITAVDSITKLDHGFIAVYHAASKKEYVLNAATGAVATFRNTLKDDITKPGAITRIVACNADASGLVVQRYLPCDAYSLDHYWIYKTVFVHQCGKSWVTKDVPTWLDNFVINKDCSRIAARRVDDRRFFKLADVPARIGDKRQSLPFDDYVTVFKNNPLNADTPITPLCEPLRMSDHSSINSPMPVTFLPDDGLLLQSKLGGLQRFSPVGTQEPYLVPRSPHSCGSSICTSSFVYNNTWCMVRSSKEKNLELITPTSRSPLKITLDGDKCIMKSLTMSNDGQVIAIASHEADQSMHIIKLKNSDEALPHLSAPEVMAARMRGHYMPVIQAKDDNCVVS